MGAKPHPSVTKMGDALLDGCIIRERKEEREVAWAGRLKDFGTWTSSGASLS